MIKLPTWQKPELIILVKDPQQENVLGVCKSAITWALNDTYNVGCEYVTKCYNCQSVGTS